MSDYAPVYTNKEKIILLIKLIVPIIPVLLVAELWFFDWLSEYVENANCKNYGSINGFHLIFYGVFVFMPLSLALILFLIEGRRSLKVIRIGQNPLPNEKVFKPTKYKYGFKARIQPYVFFGILCSLVVISIWGGFQANKFTQKIEPCDIKHTVQFLGTKTEISIKQITSKNVTVEQPIVHEIMPEILQNTSR